MPEATRDRKVNVQTAPKGDMGQSYLATGVSLSMRIWNSEQPNDGEEIHTRDYETVGYVISGMAELTLEGNKIQLEPGDSWVVPKGAAHGYRIIETFTAVEATAPPADFKGRDAP
ncbi:MAG: cupin domain-containing protein [Candidatus Competibacteraceae bacterium]|nr:cupin domain-containing protein [Candidatus Competibacteraceae bacterium]